MSKIYDDDGRYTDEYMQQLNSVVTHECQFIVKMIAYWLDSREAPIMDYNLIKAVIMENIELFCQKEWLDRIEKKEFEAVKELTDGQ